MARQKHVYDYVIDAHGTWFCEGNPVTDSDLFRMLSRSLFVKDGRYYVRCEGEVHPVRVADAPLWVRYVFLDEDSGGQIRAVHIQLEDGRREPLRPETLSVKEESALYCLATRRNLLARFAKPAYYELASRLTYEPETQAYVLTVAGRSYRLTPRT
ncbi:DUF1285 domain-containing protein [Desulfosoma caldarium]|nr:DUF1285 domain-containing protein [Desulfosoma caldarium]